MHDDFTDTTKTSIEDQLDERIRGFHAGDVSGMAKYLRATGLSVGDTRVEAVLEGLRAIVEPSPGTILGDYRVIRRIGEGGMGIVFEASDMRGGRHVAIKVMRTGRRCADSMSWKRELRALSRLCHPNITTLYHAESTDDCDYLVMELVRGRTVDIWAASLREAMGFRAVHGAIVKLVADIAETVEFAHKRGVIHLDLKPSNVLVDDDGHHKVLDFGMSRLITLGPDATPDWTHDRRLAGSLPYLAPEQIDPQFGDIDTRTDVHAIGVLLHELLSGERAYPVDPLRPMDVALRIVRGAWKKPKPSVRIDPDVDSVRRRAMAIAKKDRYQSAADLAADLRRTIDGFPVVARRRSLLYVTRKFVKRRWRTSLAILATLMACIAAIGTILDAWKDTHEAQRLAIVQLARAKTGVDVLSDLFSLTMPEMNGSARMDMVEFLTHVEQRIESQPIDDPWVEAAARAAVGMAFVHRSHPTRGIPHLRRALELRSHLHPNGHEDLAQSTRDLAFSLHANGQVMEAIQWHERALTMREKLFAADDRRVVQSVEELIEAQIAIGDRRSAVRQADAAVRAIEQVPMTNPMTRLSAWLQLARAYLESGADPAGTDLLLRVERLIRSCGVTRPSDVSTLQDLITRIQINNGQYDLAVRTSSRRLVSAALRPSTSRLVLLRNGVQIARIQHWLGKHSIALSLLENIIEEARQLLGESSAELTTWQTIRCRMLSDLGNSDAAVDAMTGVVRGCREHHGEDHPAYAKALVWLAHVQARAGRIERARTTLTKVDEYLVQKPLDTWILDQKTQVESRLHDANAR